MRLIHSVSNPEIRRDAVIDYIKSELIKDPDYFQLMIEAMSDYTATLDVFDDLHLAQVYTCLHTMNMHWQLYTGDE